MEDFLAEYLIAALISLSFGSFANTIISSYLYGKRPEIKRSMCQCGNYRLNAFELIPLAGYIFLRGRCRKCNSVISFRYFLTEILFLVLGLALYSKYGPSVLFIIYFLSFGLLIILGIVDFYMYIIPNSLVGLLFLVSLLKIFCLPGDALGCIYVSVITSGLFIAINILFRKIKGKDAIGYGDIKLIMVLMLFTEMPLSFISLWASAFIAIPGFYIMKVLLKRFHDEVRVPFGMFMSLAFILTRLLDDSIYSVYFRMLS